MALFNMTNGNMNYALKTSGKTKDQYISDLWNRVGTQSANTGKTLTEGDIYSELRRLGENPYTYKDASGNQYMYSNGQRYQLSSGNTIDPVASAKNSAVYNEYKRQQAQADADYDNQSDFYKNMSEQAKKQAWVNQTQNGKKLREYLASNGLNGSGYAESSYLGMLGNYGTALSNIDNQLAQEQMALDQNRNQTKNQYGLAMAQYLDNYAANEEAKAKEAEALAYNRSMNDYNNQYNMALQEYQNQLAQEEQDYKNAATRAQIKLNMGIIDDDVQRVYGITPSQYNAYMNQQQQSAARSTGRSGGSSGSTGEIFVVSVPQINSADKAKEWLTGLGFNNPDFMTQTEFARHNQKGSVYEGMTYQEYLQYRSMELAEQMGYTFK